MGAFFDNLHVLKNDRYDSGVLSDELCKILVAEGFSILPEATEGDVSFMIYEPDDSSWISVASDAFLFDTEDAIRKFADPISDTLNTDVLAVSCYDSDYLRLALLNRNTDTNGWINIGKSLDTLIRRTKLTPWNKLIKDTAKLKEIVKNNYTFTEEALFAIAPLIDMTPDQAMFCSDAPEPENGNILKLFFSAPEGKVELPKFRLHSNPVPTCPIGESISIYVNNVGGRSKGIGIMLIGDFVENDEITFEDARLIINNKQGNIIIPIEFEKGTLTDGKKCLCWHDKNYAIPPAVNEKLPLRKRLELEFQQSIHIVFTPIGNPDKVGDIRLVVYPISNNVNGQVSWFNKPDRRKQLFEGINR